jgi:hypothetical protein
LIKEKRSLFFIGVNLVREVERETRWGSRAMQRTFEIYGHKFKRRSESLLFSF